MVKHHLSMFPKPHAFLQAIKKPAKFQNDSWKTVVGVLHTRSKGLLTLKIRLSSQSQKSGKKYYLSITPKSHAHLQIMKKKSPLFHYDSWKTVEVAHTRYILKVPSDAEKWLSLQSEKSSEKLSMQNPKVSWLQTTKKKPT